MENYVKYLNIKEFIKEKAGIVHFGTAPDGLPLLTKINRPLQAEELLRETAWAMGVESNNPCYNETPLELFVKDLNGILKKQLFNACPVMNLAIWKS